MSSERVQKYSYYINYLDPTFFLLDYIYLFQIPHLFLEYGKIKNYLAYEYNPTNINTGDFIGNVTWVEAIEFCNWFSLINGYRPYYLINKIDGRINPEFPYIINTQENGGYRLPTVSEIDAINQTDEIEKTLRGEILDALSDRQEWCWDCHVEEIYSSDSNGQEFSKKKELPNIRITKKELTENLPSEYNDRIEYITFRLVRTLLH